MREIEPHKLNRLALRIFLCTVKLRDVKINQQLDMSYIIPIIEINEQPGVI